MSQDQKKDQENQAQKSRQEKLVGALETIKEVLVNEELESLRSSIVKVDSNLTRRLDEMSQATAESIDRLGRELSARIDALAPKLSDLEKRQTKALAELDERTSKSTADLARQLQEGQAKSEDRVRTLKRGLEQVMNEKEASLGAEVAKFEQSLTGIQVELKQQVEVTQRVSGLLNNMATVFTTGPQSPAAPQATRPRSTPPPGTVLDPRDMVIVPEGDENLDNALDRAFKADSRTADRNPAATKK